MTPREEAAGKEAQAQGASSCWELAAERKAGGQKRRLEKKTNTRQESNKTMFINKNKEIGFIFIKPSGQGRARA